MHEFGTTLTFSTNIMNNLMEILVNRVKSMYDARNTEINRRPYFYCPFKLMRTFEIYKENPSNLKSRSE